ncbi:MAG TPA: hypothetical protein VHG93_10920 [Longimicrobium sp.]|nr:hypothetical protein [Longimicrobium sp.]
MKKITNLLSLLFLLAGMAVAGPAVIGAQAEGDGGGDCIKGEYVEDDECQGALKEMCKGPPECFNNNTLE